MESEIEDTSVSRRDAIKKAAVAGAVVAWGTPVVSAIGSGGAFAQAGPSNCPGCIDGVVDATSFSAGMETDDTTGNGNNGFVQAVNARGTCGTGSPFLPTFNWTVVSTSSTGGATLGWQTPDSGSAFNQGGANSAVGPVGSTVTLNWAVTLTITCTCRYNGQGGGSYQTVHSCSATGSTTWTRGAIEWNQGVTSGVNTDRKSVV